MIDMARLFAERGVIVSLITTPSNASRFDKTIHRATESGLEIRLVQFKFPCEEAGLPKGYENLDILPSPELIKNFFNALSMLQRPLEEYLEKQTPPPSCIISDKSLYWTSKTAEKFNIPRLVFHGMSCFSLLSSHNVSLHNAHHKVTSDSQPFVVPGLPQLIKITKAQLPGEIVKHIALDDFRQKIKEAESTAYGVVVNSFDELEHGCVEVYKKAIDKKVWCIGPVSLSSKENMDKFERGNKASIDEHLCLGWLNSMKPRSVVYACLGSLCRLVPLQLIELGLGLEASNQHFIWVINTGERFSELENWLVKERFEERIKGRGLLIKGWAPQVLILSHPAIGGFISHCGWNSTIESVCSGLPIITWPLFAEQFLNEKMIVDILKIGIGVGVEIPVRWGDEEKVGVLVNQHEVQKAVALLMDRGEEGEKRRKRAAELGEMARKAVQNGGSSHLNMSILIKDITNYNTQDKE